MGFQNKIIITVSWSMIALLLTSFFWALKVWNTVFRRTQQCMNSSNSMVPAFVENLTTRLANILLLTLKPISFNNARISKELSDPLASLSSFLNTVYTIMSQHLCHSENSNFTFHNFKSAHIIWNSENPNLPDKSACFRRFLDYWD